jgi:RNA polymerase sigma factor FliA
MDPYTPHPTFDRDLLIEQYTSYVHALAAKILQKLPPGTDLQELIASGYLGLVEAAEKYDPTRGVSFSTFSYYRIRGAIFDALRKSGRYPRSEARELRFNAHANELLRSSLDEEHPQSERTIPTVDDDIASIQTVIDELIPVYFLSLDDPQAANQSDARVSFNKELEHQDLISFTRTVTKELDPADREIIEAIYIKDQTITEFAKQHGITKSWASRLHTKAILNLRRLMKLHGMF